MKKKEQDTTKKIFTIPNLLSSCRLLFLPVFVWLYMVEENYKMAALVLAVSELTDMADGYVARRFHMISDLGKVLDPVADKVTQGVVVLCLTARFPVMKWLVGLFIAKELIMMVSGLLVIKKTGRVHGADWHGKVTTCLLYFTMFLHIIWYEIPEAVSNVFAVACMVMIVISLILYLKQYVQVFQEKPVKKN